MAIKKYVDGAYEETTSLKRYVDGAWQDATSAKVFEDGAWVEKMAMPLTLSVTNSGNIKLPTYPSLKWYGENNNIYADVNLNMREGGTAYFTAVAEGEWTNPTVTCKFTFGNNPYGPWGYRPHETCEWNIRCMSSSGDYVFADSATWLVGADHTSEEYVERTANRTMIYPGTISKIEFVLCVKSFSGYHGQLKASCEDITIDGMKYAANGQIISAADGELISA